MSVIKNADGSVGNVTKLNSYQLDSNLQSKYKLLESYSETKKFNSVKAGGTNSASKEISDTTHSNMLNFLSKLEKFYFSPPSDNLWTISIELEYKNKTNRNKEGTLLPTLYNNIITTNELWKERFGSRWGVDTN